MTYSMYPKLLMLPKGLLTSCLGYWVYLMCAWGYWGGLPMSCLGYVRHLGPLIPEKPTASGFSYKRTFGYPMLHDLVPMCASLSNNTKLNNPENISYSSNCRVQTCSGSLIIFSLCGDDNLNESCTFRILCELPLLNWNILRSSRIIGELA